MYVQGQHSVVRLISHKDANALWEAGEARNDPVRVGVQIPKRMKKRH